MIHYSQIEISETPVGTVIGSTKFEEDMMDVARKLQSYGCLSLVTSITKEPTYPISEELLMKEGYKRLSISDFAVCVNNGGYIGENTAREYYFSTFIMRIPVYFVHDMVQEKMLNYINAFIVTDSGNYHLWNHDICDRAYNVKKLFIRNSPKISPDIIDMMDPNISKEFLSSILSNDLRNQMKNTDCPVVMLSDAVFESILRESKLYIPDKDNKKKE